MPTKFSDSSSTANYHLSQLPTEPSTALNSTRCPDSWYHWLTPISLPHWHSDWLVHTLHFCTRKSSITSPIHDCLTNHPALHWLLISLHWLTNFCVGRSTDIASERTRWKHRLRHLFCCISYHVIITGSSLVRWPLAAIHLSQKTVTYCCATA
jgi:hypothetical protein